MGLVLATCVWLLFVGTVFVAGPWILTLRLTPEEKRPRVNRWLISWCSKGVGVPLLVWALMNIGLSWSLQPFMPQVQAARNSGTGWFQEFLGVFDAGALIVGSYWGAVTMAWVLVSALLVVEPKQRRAFQSLAITCVIALCIPAVIIAVTGGLAAAGFAIGLVLAPMLGYGRDILQPPKLPPMYARAIARIKFGKYADAEWEIIKELENWEDDFEGWMMLAELYAQHFHDLRESEKTVLDLCAQPKITPSQVSVALHRLAEWQLKLGQDPESARRSLLQVCDRFKGSHLAHMAQLRINQLPASALEWRERQQASTIPLPALGDQLDLPPATATTDKAKASKLANACVEQLKQNPNNVTAREKLARLFAEQLGEPVLGIEQVRLLLEMPDRSAGERADWLGLIAAWYLKYCENVEAARGYLERLVREFPSSVQAFAARRRLELLSRQQRSRSDQSVP
jgi:hypothetical protein